jgi:hypothetical protein
MKPRYFLWYFAAVALTAAGAIALHAPASTVLIALVLLSCPLMMLFMMGGMGGGHGSGQDCTDSHSRHDAAGS